MVGLNFSEEQEADKFHKALETKIKDRHQRRQSKICLLLSVTVISNVYIVALKQKKDTFNSSNRVTSPPGVPAPALPNSPHSSNHPTPAHHSPLQPIQESPHAINTSSISSTGITSTSSSSSSSSNKGNKGGKRKKILKSDISGPSNFQ